MAQVNEIAFFHTALSENVKGVTYFTIDATEIEKMSERPEHRKIPNFKGTMKVHQVKKDLSQKSFPQLHFYSLIVSSLCENNWKYHFGRITYH